MVSSVQSAITIRAYSLNRTITWFAPGLVFAALFILGIFLRLVDITDPPLDYHPTRQLRSAIIARAMYYQMSPEVDPALTRQAVEAWNYLEVLEPPLFERLVALTYVLAGGEILWVAYLYTALFWTVGGLALFDLARRLVSTSGALLTLAYFLLTPFAVINSRVFMPDPLMVMWIILSAWALYWWMEALPGGGHWRQVL